MSSLCKDGDPSNSTCPWSLSPVIHPDACMKPVVAQASAPDAYLENLLPALRRKAALPAPIPD